MSFRDIAKGEPVRKSEQMIGVATNTDIFNPMRDDIDLGCGLIVTGSLTIEKMCGNPRPFARCCLGKKEQKRRTELGRHEVCSPSRRRGDLIP